MSGTPAGGQRTRETIRQRYGEGYYQALGRLGGQKPNPKKGFAADRTLASRAGQKGG